MTAQIRPRDIARTLLPGMILPAITYTIASRSLATLPALAVASCFPLADVIVALVRRRSVNLASLGFFALATATVSLGLLFHSPRLIVIKPAVVAGTLALAFGGSALLQRPLTRTLAIRFSAGGDAALRAELTRRWHHPVATRIFRVIALGWSAWLLVSAARTLIAAFTLPPGTAFMLEVPAGPLTAAIGIAATLLYVRRFRTSHPELGLWFASA